jgi:FixJ family two-component response regulator
MLATSTKRLVLLVDDDESLRRALARAIRLAGFDVEAFASAETMLVRGTGGARCLILDIDLPGVDGLACKRALEVSGRDLATIFITALPASEVRELLPALCPVAVLYKPFKKADLIAAIGEACA